MKKLVLLLSVIALLIIATGAVSAAKPAPDTFTITGYTTNNPFEDNETLPNGHVRYHILAQGGGEDAVGDEFCEALSLGAFTTCVDLCEHYTSQACGVSGELNGSFTFEEWVDVNPVNGKAKNEGIVTIIGAAPARGAVVDFKGEIDQAAQTVSGKFKVDKKRGTGAYNDLKGQGDYTGGAAFVFTVTFTGKLKD
jgi:hypothetical protein